MIAILLLVGVIVIPLIKLSGKAVDRDDSVSRSRKLKDGWVTNCESANFSTKWTEQAYQIREATPVFKINDQLLLAVPEKNGPAAASIQREPLQCRSTEDLPFAQFLTFVVEDKWYSTNDNEPMPRANDSRALTPKMVFVRIEKEFDGLSSAKQRERQALLWNLAEHNSAGVNQLGDITCFEPKVNAGWTSCFKQSPDAYTDFTRIRYATYNDGRFILALADYPSIRFGGIHLYWKTWTSDISHIPEIDASVWKTIDEWNLLSNATSSGH